MSQLLGSTAIAILSPSSLELKLAYSVSVRNVILGLDFDDDNDFWRTAKEFLEQCTIDCKRQCLTSTCKRLNSEPYSLHTYIEGT